MDHPLPRSALTLAILAGGRGARLGGVQKGLLTFEGRTFIERLLELRELCAAAMVVSADPAYDRFGVPRVEDVEPDRGAPGGVVTALLRASTPWVLVVACDMPFVTREVAQLLIDAAGSSPITCFQRGGQPEPLLAIYQASLGAGWRAQLQTGPSLRALISATSPRLLEAPDPRVLDSINLPDQLPVER